MNNPQKVSLPIKPDAYCPMCVNHNQAVHMDFDFKNTWYMGHKTFLDTTTSFEIPVCEKCKKKWKFLDNFILYYGGALLLLGLIVILIPALREKIGLYICLAYLISIIPMGMTLSLIDRQKKKRITTWMQKDYPEVWQQVNAQPYQ